MYGSLERQKQPSLFNSGSSSKKFRSIVALHAIEMFDREGKCVLSAGFFQFIIGRRSWIKINKFIHFNTFKTLSSVFDVSFLAASTAYCCCLRAWRAAKPFFGSSFTSGSTAGSLWFKFGCSSSWCSSQGTWKVVCYLSYNFLASFITFCTCE